MRHLRRIYPDPMTRTTDWGLVRLEGRIVGVYSQSPERPAKQANFPAEFKSFEQQESYTGWIFLAMENNPAAVK